MVFDLGGVWDFQTAGAADWPREWAGAPLPEPMTMAVPASYNDQKDDVNLRAHYGWAVYQRAFTIPRHVSNQRVVLRFGAVTHAAQVWLDDCRLGEHKGGLPALRVRGDGLLRRGAPPYRGGGQPGGLLHPARGQ